MINYCSTCNNVVIRLPKSSLFYCKCCNKLKIASNILTITELRKLKLQQLGI